MQGMLPFELAELLQFKPGADRFLVLVRIVRNPLAACAFEFDEVVLGHNLCYESIAYGMPA